VFLSLSRQCEGFERLRDFPAPCFHVDTYTSAADAARRSLGLPALARRITSFVRAHRIDVVVATMRHPWSGIAFRAMRRGGAKVVLMVHDATPHTGEDYPFWKALFRFELAATDGIIVLSDHVGAAMATLYGYPRSRIWTMAHPSTDYLAEPRTAPRRLAGRPPTRLLFFGRIHQYKGLDLLADAYAKLRSSRPVTLRIVGNGWVAALDRLSTMAGVSIERRWIKDEEIGGLLEEADILLLPYTEASQSGVLATSYGSALPAVVTPVGGLAEQAGAGTGAIIANRVDAEAFAAAVRMLIDDPALYEQLSERALAVAQREQADPAAIETLRSMLSEFRQQGVRRAG
jgi:glycosyltransferase involved in cell wall biosynthesis